MEQEQLEINVQSITAINNSLEECFVKKLLLRLNCFGYKYEEEKDNWCLCFSIDKELNRIKNICNIKCISKELEEILIDRIIGDFLFGKKQSNQLDLDNFDLDMAVKSLQMGDTNITFATGEGSNTDEDKLNSLIAFLQNNREEELVCFRKLRW